MRILGINALFHDPAAALVVDGRIGDGRIVAAAEEERFSRRKHGKRPLPFSAWELPELSARRCLEHAGLRPEELDAVSYSFDPALARPAAQMGLSDPWDPLRLEYARRAPEFLAEALPGLDPAKVVFVPHHVAHASSAGPASPHPDSAVLVLDGRGEAASHLAGRLDGGRLGTLALPDSLGLVYEELTEHLGFLRSSDEYKVMALASYGTLAEDLSGTTPDTAGVQGVITVPLPDERPPTDWERGTAGLARSRWITADMAYRTDALKQVGGFDERFRRTFREDADIALRLLDAGRRVRQGRRTTRHPVRPADRWVSLRAQRGNADDALMRRLHGSDWWDRAAAPRGRIRAHLALTAVGTAACALAASGHRRASAVAALGWLAGTGEFTWARVGPGPRTRDEVITMSATSVLIPPAATWQRLRGQRRHRAARPWPEVAP
ncbi:carbamoyltransferase N-terminal domain-containing protein [Streptomyces sp. 378]|uniref:carbamoyltransferase N-terminal domain-containing protein n=1 Tax=Streptomyces sp. 378 TaxID=3049412 RepID=UPI0024C2226F|nr:carbamoyltransferase N-terminal domain-containing protein [Streptomyces sp. 378]MDK1342344.1 carbamoyltransferase N-terminal domain-containing protein [Streptomyces sp. 378]